MRDAKRSKSSGVLRLSCRLELERQERSVLLLLASTIDIIAAGAFELGISARPFQTVDQHRDCLDAITRRDSAPGVADNRSLSITRVVSPRSRTCDMRLRLRLEKRYFSFTATS